MGDNRMKVDGVYKREAHQVKVTANLIFEQRVEVDVARALRKRDRGSAGGVVLYATVRNRGRPIKGSDLHSQAVD